ncbi:MAG: GAF domain-containing protein [Chloroflexi bacterium]|nr:GAF domain-containing protein [Chloroflexota bacterium]
MKALRAERVRFARWDPATGEDRVELSIGYAPEIEERFLQVCFSSDSASSLSGWVLSNHAPLNVPDVSADPRYVIVDPQIRSGLWVPIEHEGAPRGTLAVLSTRPDAFTEPDEKLLTLFASQLAAAMENARLFQETKRRLAELEAVNRISTALRTAQTIDTMVPLFLREAAEALDSTQSSLWLYDPARGALYQHGVYGDLQADYFIMPGEGIGGHVFDSGEPYFSRDFGSDPLTLERARARQIAGRNGVCVPVCAGLQAIGVMFASVDAPRQFNTAQTQLLTTLAEIAGNAIHRMRLYEQTTQRASELAIVNKLGHTLGETRDLTTIYQRTVTAALMVLPDVTTMLICLVTPAGDQLTCAFGIQDGSAVDVSTLPPLLLDTPEHAAEDQAIRSRRSVIIHGPATSVWRSLMGLNHAAALTHTVMLVPLLAQASVIGMIQAYSDTPNRFTPADTELLELIAHPAASAIENARLFADLQHAYDETIEGWARALDLRDRETEGHTRRVVEHTVTLARAMGVPETMLPHIRRGALLHDIGKVGIPDAILLKPGPLTNSEWETMRMHPSYAYALLSSIEYLSDALDIPYCHHEKWDGTGYPRGLRETEIPLAARIFAIVDVWDALCSNRPYRAAWPREKALNYIREQAGVYFDPAVVREFLRLENAA